VAAAQYIMAMFLHCAECEAGIKADILDAARWLCMAAKQGLSEAQYEVGEMLRHGIVCDLHMRFARKYIRRAANQGHVEANARMQELHSCVMCGADNAPIVCARCEPPCKILRRDVLEAALVRG